MTPFALAFIFSLISAFNFDVEVCYAEEYLHTYANRRAHIVAHNKAYGHIEAVRGKPKVDEDGKVIKDEKTGAIEYEGDVAKT
jgi:hypothetical protein